MHNRWSVKHILTFQAWNQTKIHKWCVCLDRIPRWSCPTFFEAFTAIRDLEGLGDR